MQTAISSKLNRALMRISKSLSSWTPAPVRGLVTIFLPKRSSFFVSELSSTASPPIWPKVQPEEIPKSDHITLVQMFKPRRNEEHEEWFLIQSFLGFLRVLRFFVVCTNLCCSDLVPQARCIFLGWFIDLTFIN